MILGFWKDVVGCIAAICPARSEGMETFSVRVTVFEVDGWEKTW